MPRPRLLSEKCFLVFSFNRKVLSLYDNFDIYFMKKFFLMFYGGLVAFMILILSGCNSAPRCHIIGYVNASLEGKKIYLVPLFGPQDKDHFDSTFIHNHHFFFKKDSTELAIVRVDYHYRYGLEDMLVITEPGQVKVTIGPISSCGGTPQNDSLQAWKKEVMRFRQNARSPLAAARLKVRTLQIVAHVKANPLHDFLQSVYPTSKTQ
ncbi:MAG TPA: hypothetical protein DCS83_03640 [Prevotella sp.]|nr:hypothetical protein [Prevotella sp.]